MNDATYNALQEATTDGDHRTYNQAICRAIQFYRAALGRGWFDGKGVEVTEKGVKKLLLMFKG